MNGSTHSLLQRPNALDHIQGEPRLYVQTAGQRNEWWHPILEPLGYL